MVRSVTAKAVTIGLDAKRPEGRYGPHRVPPADAVRGNVAPAGSATTPSACTDRGSSGAAALCSRTLGVLGARVVFPSHDAGGYFVTTDEQIDARTTKHQGP